MCGTRHVIEVTDLCFSYGEREVLHNVSFLLPTQSFVVVVGPNGGGKSTLLRLLLGSLKPRYGTVKVFGENPAAARHRIGFVPQTVTYDPDFPLTVTDAVALGRGGARLFGGITQSDRKAADDALQLVGLDGLGGRLFSELSGGQRQRAIIAQALCTDPELLLLDEPTANVDSQTERSLYRLFEQLSKRKTVVLVSHNLSIVAAHATHLLCVNRTIDLHCMAEDVETHLKPLADGTLAFVQNKHPEHLEELMRIGAATPHRGETSPILPTEQENL